MRIWKLMKRSSSRMEWYDISFVKLSTLFFTLMLVTAWPGFRNAVLSVSWHWYLTLAVVFAIHPIRRLCSK